MWPRSKRRTQHLVILGLLIATLLSAAVPSYAARPGDSGRDSAPEMAMPETAIPKSVMPESVTPESELPTPDTATGFAQQSLPSNTNEREGFVPGQLLISFKKGVSTHSHESLLQAHGLALLAREERLDASVVSVPVGHELDLAQILSQDPGVAFAEPIRLYYASFVPDDSLYATYQWHMPKIGMPAVWDITSGSISVTVAVIDTGLDTEHPDAPVYLADGYDFANDDDDPSDDKGHGTHVAGTIAANTNNAIGVAGVAPNTTIMPIKVLNSEGSGNGIQVAQGIYYATDHGADIINMSLGGPDLEQVVVDAVNYAYSQGVAIVVAAGNSYENGNAPSYPAALPNVLAVAATGNLDEHAFYSNTGFYVDIAAPGGNPTSGDDPDPGHWIMSTNWTGTGYSYQQSAGTSMAAPHVAGVLALIKAENPTLSVDQLYDRVCSTAYDLGDHGWDEMYGWGRVDAYAALDAGAPTETPTNTPTSTNTPVTPTATSTPSSTPTSTSTPSATPTATNTPVTPTATNTPSATPTSTNTPVTPTATNTPSSTPTSTSTPSATPSATSTPVTPTATGTPSSTPTSTNTPSSTPTSTSTPSATPSATSTPVTPTATGTPSATPTSTNTPVTPTATGTPSATPSTTSTPSATPSTTSTPSATPTSTSTPSATPTVLIGGISNDSYEPDDLYSQASTISLGERQVDHSIHVISDQDWTQFTLAHGAQVVLETSDPTSAAIDTTMVLYKKNGALLNVVDQNNDGGQQLCSRIAAFLEAGDYFVKIEEGGNDQPIASYDLALSPASLDPWIRAFGVGSGGWVDMDTYPRALADVNGDGISDIVGFGHKATYVSLSDGNDFQALQPWIASYGVAAGGWSSQNLYPRMLADVNGDDMADIVGFGHKATYVSLSTGDGFEALRPWIANYGVAAGGWSSQNLFPRMLADVNGDGMADIVGFGNRATYVSLSTGSSFGPVQTWINGYGVAAGGWSSQNLFPRQVADVNGDGMADIVGFGDRATYVSLSTGSSFGPLQTWVNAYGVTAGGWATYDLYPRMLGDVDDDGDADIIGFGSRATYVSLSTGSAFEPSIVWVNSYGVKAGGWTSQNLYPRMIGDIGCGDGEGNAADIVGIGYRDVYGTIAD